MSVKFRLSDPVLQLLDRRGRERARQLRLDVVIAWLVEQHWPQLPKPLRDEIRAFALTEGKSRVVDMYLGLWE
jgi:hypothetical protein